MWERGLTSSRGLRLTGTGENLVPFLNLSLPRPGVRAYAFLALSWAALQGTAQVESPVNTITAELREHHAQAALADAAAALKVQPGDPRLWVLKGLAARELGNAPGAMTAFEEALHLRPDYLPALEGAAETAYGTDPAKAGTYAERVLRLEPGNPTANGMAAMLDFRRGDWTSAAAHFQSSGPGMYMQRGTLEAYADTLGQLGRDAEAEPLFERLLQTWPEDEGARYNLAVLQLRGNRATDAAHTIEPLVAAHNPQALSLAASAHEAAGDTPRAVALLREAIERDPKNPQNYLDFAAISFDHSSSTAGIAIVDAGLKQLPRSAPLWIARGILSMQTSQLAEAEEDFAAANRLDPSQSFGLEAQGLTDVQRHDLPGALAKVEASLAADPTNAYLHYLAAEILKEQGAAPGSAEAAKAIADARRSLELAPKLTAPRDLLSSLYFQAGELPLAEEQCRAALRQDASDQEAIFRLILILRRSGDKAHETPGLVAALGKARASAHGDQLRIDRYRLAVTP